MPHVNRFLLDAACFVMNYVEKEVMKMEITCTTCGNRYDDSIGVCPACGTAAAPQAEQPAADPSAESTGAQQTNSYSYSYSYGANGQQQNYQQQSYQQPYQQNYQQQPYQQNYQQQSYQQNYQQPYQQPYGQGYPTQGGQQKSKIVAGLLGIFLGCFGVHNFYLGYTGKAVAQLLLSILSCFILAPLSAIWGLIEGVLLLVGSIPTDANGIPLGD